MSLIPLNIERISSAPKQVEREFVEEFSVDELVGYLKKSHQFFFDQSIPKIEQNFLLLTKYYQDHHQLKVIFRLFLKFQIDLRQHIEIEEKVFFPYIETLYQSTRENSSLLPVLLIHYGKYSIQDFADTHKDSECYLTEIILLLKEQKTISNHSIFRLLLTQLCKLNDSIKTHSWIEDEVLVKKVIEIENVVTNFVDTLKKDVI